MRTRLLAGSLALATAAVLAGGATYAKFNDTEQGQSQSVVSGTFSLDTVNPNLAPTFPINITNAKPASVWSVLAGGTKQIIVQNTGSLPGNLSVNVANVVDSENGCLDPETEAGDTTCGTGATDGELSSQQLLSVRTSTARHNVINIGPIHLDLGWTCDPVLPGTFQTVAGSANPGAFSFGTLGAGAAKCLTAFTYLPDQANNNLVQSDSVTFDVAMHLDQP
jgi:predicted ribosomally synthesized peptide with SipW-like signal peptide